MWNESIRLPTGKNAQKDVDGFETDEIVWSEEIPAELSDITRGEATLALQAGYTADIAVRIMACNYHREACIYVVSQDAVYDIKRSYTTDGETILTGQRREGGKHYGESY